MFERLRFWRPRKELDVLFATAPIKKATLRDQLDWLSELMFWVLGTTRLNIQFDFSSGEKQALRVKWLLSVLARNPEWQKKFVEILASVVRQSRVYDLLVQAGLHQEQSLWSEAIERIQQLVLPQPPEEENFAIFFRQTFRSVRDAKSLGQLDLKSIREMMTLLRSHDEKLFAPWARDLREAIKHLSAEMLGASLKVDLRSRMSTQYAAQSPFYKLNHDLELWLGRANEAPAAAKSDRVKSAFFECSDAIENIYKDLDQHGVSLAVVYQAERLRSLLNRAHLLFELIEDGKIGEEELRVLAETLAEQVVESRSLFALFNESTALLSKKVAESGAETGENYIARSKFEFQQLFSSAIGGGLITAATAVLKILIYGISFSAFLGGLAASVNYSLSFLIIQWRHFTLATKQPAMTAASLARLVADTAEGAERLRLEIRNILKSQLVAVGGNVLAVVPMALLICQLHEMVFGRELVATEKAHETLRSFSLMGLTPVYAVWTGVLLFLSSQISGWVHHWMLARRLPQAIAGNRNFRRILNEDRARFLAEAVRNLTAPVAANVSLGFLLGMVPVFGKFLGLPLDVRHITLSSGSVAVALFTLGIEGLKTSAFLLSVGGLLTMVVFNIGVSFSLALVVALRSKRASLSTSLQVLKSVAWSTSNRK